MVFSLHSSFSSLLHWHVPTEFSGWKERCKSFTLFTDCAINIYNLYFKTNHLTLLSNFLCPYLFTWFTFMCFLWLPRPLMLNDSSTAHSMPKYNRQYSLEPSPNTSVSNAHLFIFVYIVFILRITYELHCSDGNFHHILWKKGSNYQTNNRNNCLQK